MARATQNDYLVLAAILALALVLRIIGLNQPLWYDELITLHTHLRLPWSEMMSGYEMNHHYLYSFQTKLIMGLFGDAPWVLRLQAVLFGVGAIGATWLLIRQMTETRYAHITAALLALSYHHIWFSQNARGYTELMFWSTLGLILFLRGLKNPTRKTWIWFAITLALAVFTHLTGFFVFFAMGVVWLLWTLMSALKGTLEKPQILLPALSFIGGGLLCLILYAPVLPGVFENAATVGGTSEVDVMKEFQNPIWTVLEAVRSIAAGLGPLIGIVAIATLTLSTLGAIKIWPHAPLFPLVVFAHIVLTMALLYTLGMRIWPRFFFVDIGFLLALIVLGVAFVCDRLDQWLPKLFPISVAAMLLISAGLAAQNYRAPKQNIPGPMELIARTAEGQDEVYTVGFVGQLYTTHLNTGWSLITTSQDLQKALKNDARKWLVVGFPGRSFRAIDGLDAAVENFDLVERFPGTLGDGAMLVYREKE